MTAWRFDQGRLDYFQFDEIKRMAVALADIDGIPKPTVNSDVLRHALAAHSARPFAPNTYTVWRNYKRVFGCALLAAEVAGKIVCTDVCKQLANQPEDVDADDYLGHFVTHFYYPSPVFEGYRPVGTQIFPAVAILKLLLSKYLFAGTGSVTLSEIAERLIGNNVTGLEDISFYAKLQPKKVDADMRQLRELARFISQLTFLKWGNASLYLEVESKVEAAQLVELLPPKILPRNQDAGAEVLNLGANFQGANKTSVKDIVGLCPSCHRATHKYYGSWFKANRVKDFRSYDEARHVYAEARRSIVLVEAA